MNQHNSPLKATKTTTTHRPPVQQTAETTPQPSTFDSTDLVMLQRQIGNRAVQRLLAQREAVPAAKQITKMPSRNAQRHIQRNIFHSMFKGYARKNIFGKNRERRAIPEDTATLRTRGTAFFQNITDISVQSGIHTLRGRHYVGIDADDATDGGKYAGKTVLFLSGSGGSAEKYGYELARYYCVRGADFVAVNYRGFGGSTYGPKNKQLDNSAITEQGIYDDAHAIFAHLQGTMGIAPGDIVIHGFSLGGPVAAELVNHLAGQGIRVSGLVLHSPMDSVKAQARNVAGSAGEFVANASGVVMDLRQHLTALSRQPGFADLAIHFMSGKNANGDQLGFDATNVNTDAVGMGFTNTTTTMSNTGDHENVAAHIRTAGRGANVSDNPQNSLDRLFASPVDVSSVQPSDQPPAELAPVIEQLVAVVSDDVRQSETEASESESSSKG